MTEQIKMKKYYQLILLILSALSILCFVFYKHEYDRLRKVLEVLDFFGTPTTDDTGIAIAPSCSNGSLEFLPDFWHAYAEDVHIYSAYKMSNGKGWNMNSLAVVGKDASMLLKKSSCALISGDAADDKFEGTIEWKKLSNDSSSTAYSVTCNVPEMIGNSHLFSLYDAKGAVQALNVPLHLGNELKDNAISLCVVSAEPYWHATEMIDFILYYATLGVDNFYLYHRGIGDHVISALKTLVYKRSNITVNLAPWNRPITSLNLLDFPLVSHDCAWRHSGKTGPSITMQMGHFLVLPKGTGLIEFLMRISRRGSESTYEARLALQSLCSNMPTTDQSALRLPRLMKNPKRKDFRNALIRWTDAPNHPTTVETVKVDPHTAKMLVFEICPTTGLEKTDDDPSLRRFSAIAQSIPLIKV